MSPHCLSTMSCVCRVQDGVLRPTAMEAERLIEQALGLNPRHPLAIHLYIHLSEASSPLRCEFGTLWGTHRVPKCGQALCAAPAICCYS